MAWMAFSFNVLWVLDGAGEVIKADFTCVIAGCKQKGAFIVILAESVVDREMATIDWMNKSSVSTLGVDTLHWPSQIASPCGPFLIPKQCSSTGNLLSCVEIPEEKFIGSTSWLKIAAVSWYIKMSNIGGVFLHWSVLSPEFSLFIVFVNINGVVVRAQNQQIIAEFNVGYLLFSMFEAHLGLEGPLFIGKDFNSSIFASDDNPFAIGRDPYRSALWTFMEISRLLILLNFNERLIFHRIRICIFNPIQRNTTYETPIIDAPASESSIVWTSKNEVFMDC